MTISAVIIIILYTLILGKGMISQYDEGFPTSYIAIQGLVSGIMMLFAIAQSALGYWITWCLMMALSIAYTYNKSLVEKELFVSAMVVVTIISFIIYGIFWMSLNWALS